MGRAKLKMELISKEKSRNTTFKKRKEGLIRKLHEFTTLCDVKACMIIYGPKQETSPSLEPETWPKNQDQVCRVIDRYKAQKREAGSKTFGLSDFFQDRKRKIEEEVDKIKKKNMESRYPTWVQPLDLLTEGELREFALALRNKADYVRSRIGLLRRFSNRQGLVMDNLMGLGFGQVFYEPTSSMGGLGENGPNFSVGQELELDKLMDWESGRDFYEPTFATGGGFGAVGPNISYREGFGLDDLIDWESGQAYYEPTSSMGQIGGGGPNLSNRQAHDNLMDRKLGQVSYEPTMGGLGGVDPTVGNNPWSVANYYSPPLPPLQPLPHMVAPPHLHFYEEWTD